MTSQPIGIEDRIAAAYRNGSTIRDIAADEGRTYQAVRGILLRNGVRLRSRGGYNRDKRAAKAGAA